MKKRWIVLIVLGCIAIGAYLYLRIRKTDDFEPQVKAKLAEMVSAASNGLYQLDMEHIEIDVTAGAVIAKNITLLPDSARMLELEKIKELPNDIFTVHLGKLDLEGLSPLELINGKNISLEHLVLDSPEIKITRTNRRFEKKDTNDIYQKLAPKNQTYSIGELLLRNIRLTLVNADKNKSTSSFKNLSASLKDIQIDSTTRSDRTRFLFAKETVIFIKGFNTITNKNIYRFNIDSVAFLPQKGTLNLVNLRLEPIGSKDEFNKKHQFMTDRYDISVQKTAIINADWFSLMSGDGIYGDEMILDGGFLKVYDDRSQPLPTDKTGNFPHQMLMKAGIPINIKKVKLNDLYVGYEEFNVKSNRTGKVEFHHVNGEITNATNDSVAIKENGNTIVTATAVFMNAGKLDATFNFDLRKARQGAFTVDATLGAMNGLPLNTITENLALLKIKKLEVDKLTAHINGNNIGATGKVSFAYHDLSFEVLKNNDEGELKKRGLLTFIADKFIVKNESPGKEEAVAFQRDKQKSFFNLVWKTILAGLTKTVK